VDGQKLGGQQALFEDVADRYDIAQVSRGADGEGFQPLTSDAPSLGFSKSTVWLRFAVHNPAPSAREWLLEVAYPSDQSRIFESFVQAEGGATRRFGGSGLGLAITKQLVLLHKGESWVESELGHGSRFHVRLPELISAPAMQGVA
jgi:hypothetical protein